MTAAASGCDDRGVSGMGKECTIKSWACDWCLRRGGRVDLVVVRKGEREVEVTVVEGGG